MFSQLVDQWNDAQRSLDGQGSVGLAKVILNIDYQQGRLAPQLWASCLDDSLAFALGRLVLHLGDILDLIDVARIHNLDVRWLGLPCFGSITGRLPTRVLVLSYLSEVLLGLTYRVHAVRTSLLLRRPLGEVYMLSIGAALSLVAKAAIGV